MEHTALRPRPLPGRGPRAGGGPRPGGGPAHHPHAANRRRRRLRTLLLGACAGTLLVLSGVGIGAVGATVLGGAGETAPQPRAAAAPARDSGPRATLGVEAVDYGSPGALVVGVHTPGPGYRAGLARGDVLLQFGAARVDTAADLARAVARARPGSEVLLTVRHSGGGFQQLTVVPGVVT
ncbi:PDZ domain-containing protein [Streptomyces griseofuscus]|uniref:PDZ domain-containing protein n=1 Tax=Streptomyces griseofuscus TaxID=146922 RepID=UPI00118CC71D|nr:PDZ domain-containing protein [Streptomyces rochei]